MPLRRVLYVAALLALLALSCTAGVQNRRLRRQLHSEIEFRDAVIVEAKLMLERIIPNGNQ